MISAGALPPASRSSCSSISQARSWNEVFQYAAQGLRHPPCPRPPPVPGPRTGSGPRCPCLRAISAPRQGRGPEYPPTRRDCSHCPCGCRLRSSGALRRVASALPSPPRRPRPGRDQARRSSPRSRHRAGTPGARPRCPAVGAASIHNNASGRGIGGDSRSMTSERRAAAGPRRGWASWTARPQERTEARSPNRHPGPAPAAGSGFLLLGFQLAKQGLGPGQFLVRQDSRPGPRAGAVRSGGHSPPRSPAPHDGARGIPDRLRVDRVLSIRLPGSPGTPRPWPQAGLARRTGIRSPPGWPDCRAGRRRGASAVYEPDGGVGVGQQGSDDLPGRWPPALRSGPRARARAAKPLGTLRRSLGVPGRPGPPGSRQW